MRVESLLCNGLLDPLSIGNARPERAVLHITSLGVYEIYVNGGKVGENVLAPEWVSSSGRCRTLSPSTVSTSLEAFFDVLQCQFDQHIKVH